MVDEIFSEHQIAQTIKKDLNGVKTSPAMQKFNRGLQFKSEATKTADLELVNLLLLKLDQYSEGWIRCNANNTAELWNKSKALDQQRETVHKSLKPELDQINNRTNDLVVKMKNRMNPEQLERMRSLEIAYRQIKEI